MFDKRIKDILREILTLKNLKNKSAMVLRTIEKPFSANFEIVASGVGFCSDKIAVVKITNSGLPPIAQVYFDVVAFDYRTLSVHRVIDANGDLNFYISIASDENPTDISEIQQGHQVVVNYDCKIVSTTDSAITIDYIQNPQAVIANEMRSIDEPPDEAIIEEDNER